MDSFYSDATTGMTFDQKIGAALQFNNLSASTKNVLAKVYTTLSFCMLTCVAGTLFSMFIYQANFILVFIASLVTIYKFVTTQTYKKNERLSYLLLFCLLTGVSLTPLINMAISINESIVITALMATTGIFVSFTLFSLLTDKRSFLFMGGTLASACLGLFVLSLSQVLFIHSEQLDWIITVSYFLLMVVFLVYDTQMIVYRIERGYKDELSHAFTLFIDFVDIFRMVLKLLMKQEKRRERNNN
ncbi:hypothetical protein PPL_06203 [Heterostelium album PN500]|uniref:Uncharacterized protein n=1 Tax=Heterostelium pallidum (strain ATCC 26659 / Pp 5 / PN500) TaxID=670386 RepID=D3BCH8_HETP5|nr:hypothetical protein PPL_06203 [Heterostelium album PN500]EFA80968.1 hypothetical protein PPL_06203 [Heterostelium album PN500]|eukprot:XP_020433086.1 hypothetical protein PPL_06203 [Heterostelium album PN500]